MNNINQEKLVDWIFETKAISVCQDDSPFWYASGTIGPYFVNTHFLYGSEKKANHFLELIEKKLNDRLNLTCELFNESLENYSSNETYKGIIDMSCKFLSHSIDVDNIDAISGGERRDWFFSFMISYFLKKPHIAIFKNGEIQISENGKTFKHNDINSINGMRVLHVADLITKASSFEKFWIPFLEKNSAKVKESFAIIDRKQGGRDILKNYNSGLYTLLSIQKNLFLDANKKCLIDDRQLKLVLEYLEEPSSWAREFIKNNPKFLEKSLNTNGKTKERAKLWMNGG